MRKGRRHALAVEMRKLKAPARARARETLICLFPRMLVQPAALERQAAQQQSPMLTDSQVSFGASPVGLGTFSLTGQII